MLRTPRLVISTVPYLGAVAPRVVLHTRCSPLFLAIGVAALGGCGGDPSASTLPTLAVATVEVSPVSDTLTVLGQTVQFTAVAKDAAGNVLTGKTFLWSSSDPSVATVVGMADAIGLATSVGDGSATIRAVSGGKASTASIAVILPVASVTVSPDSPMILRGTTLQLTATLNSQAGNTLAGRSVTWSSTAPAIATVDSEGLVTGAEPGSSGIVASAEGHSDTTTVTVTIIDFASVDPGTFHTCGLTTSGVAYCWGNGSRGVLGVGAVTESCPGLDLGDNPCNTKPMAVSGNITFATLSVANGFTCGLTASGAGYCWGVNDDGQLGNASTRDAKAPRGVSGGLSFASIRAGGNFACGLTTGGEAYCWGSNNQGQLGTTAVSDTCEDTFEGPVPCSTVPLAVTGGLTFTSISTGGQFACGITAGGAAYCWGNNGNGVLGNGSSDGDRHPAPELVAGGLSFASVSAGITLACGLTTSGETYCWGSNSGGGLGNGFLFGGAQPTPGLVLGGLTFASISTGLETVCGVTTSSVAYCWGGDWGGNLGIGTTGDRSTPTAVSGGLSFASVSTDFFHTCGLTTSGEVYCWGSNEFGQLGNGSTASRSVPVKVIGSR